MATKPAAPEKMTLDRSDGSATLDLYRAALGPLRADYYLKAFTRFDAAGKSGPSWNWAAALLSLNWMLFRKLWIAALAYVGVLMAATLLLLGIGRLVFQLSPETQWLLAALAVSLAILIPGAYGNAWLYARCNRQMERALAACVTLEDAYELLSREAIGTKRMVLLAGLNVSLGLLIAAVLLSSPFSSALPVHTSPASQAPVAQAHVEGLVQNAPTVQAANAQASVPSVAASAPPLSARLVASAPQVATSAVPPSQNSAQRSNLGMVQEGASAAAALASPSPTAVATAPGKSPALTLAPSAGTKLTSTAEPAKPKGKHEAEKVEPPSNTAKAAKLTKAEQRAKAKADKADKATKSAKAEKAATKAAEKSLANNGAAAVSTPDSGKFLINVGLFADDNNARNALVKLQDAGLPALSQEIKSSKGKRTRVRVGPFESQPEADHAAERIRALQLEAVVFKQ
jgi:cell division septation protein DedD